MGTRGSLWTGECAGADRRPGWAWGLLGNWVKPGVPRLPLLPFLPFLNSKVRCLQAASPERARGCSAERTAIQVHG